MSEPLKIPTLGRSFSLGILYDCRSDLPLPNETVWCENALKKASTKASEAVSQFDIITSDIPSVDALGVGGSLKLSFLGGLIKESDVSGSAKYLYSYKSSKQQARVAIRYKYISHTERIDQKLVPNYQHCTFSSEVVGTHIVTGLSYGAEAIFVFDQEVADCKKYQQISKELEEEAIRFCNALNEQCDVDLLQLPMVQESKVSYFGDIQAQEKLSTFPDVARFCKNLPDLFIGKNNHNLFPKQAYLHPLSMLEGGTFHCLDSGLVSRVQTIIQHIQHIEIRCKGLMETNISQYFIGIQKQLLKFSTIVSKYKQDFVEQLANLLPKIRGGQEEDRELENLCEKYLTSEFNCEVLSNWIEDKECEVTFVAECIEELQQVPGTFYCALVQNTHL